jgi:spore maturation protein CgeB
MADASQKLLTDPVVRAEVGAAAKRKVNDLYSPEQQMRKLLNVIVEIFNKSPLKPKQA